MNEEIKTLWLWDSLPKKGLKSEEQTWLKEGDAVENVDRLALGTTANNRYKSSGKKWSSRIRIEEKYN